MPFLSVGPAESLASAMSASVKAAHPYARSTWRTIQHLGTNTRSSCSGIPVPAWAFLDCRRNGQARLSEVGDVRFAPMDSDVPRQAPNARLIALLLPFWLEGLGDISCRGEGGT